MYDGLQSPYNKFESCLKTKYSEIRQSKNIYSLFDKYIVYLSNVNTFIYHVFLIKVSTFNLGF